ncbi:phosphoglycerate mutase-like protein [Ascodesmis nigricans]|uniref:Phosphoglycerate mutase-like protein n=1 Tax=Ascodesmis nigricans TaxID=341454 RepID=A0A4V3SJG7_9PEZI|nr:phosphoglycerate mutase-like protein [Ascodesmis nigricans]
MPIRLILIRHAQTPHNATSTWAGRTDSTLTALGHTQAQHLGHYLSTHFPAPTRIFVSPLQRTHLTASHIPPYPSSLPREIVPEIKERDFGPVDDTPHTVMPDPAGVETMESVELRADGFWERWWEEGVLKGAEGKGEDQLVVAVSHGAFIPALWKVMERRWEVVGEAKGEDTMGRWRNTAFCVLRFEEKVEGGWRVMVERNMGTPHLDATMTTKQPVIGEEGATYKPKV